jgi:hypothetical protein
MARSQTMAFDFESLGVDWAISLTDLLLAIAAFIASHNANSAKISFDFYNQINLVSICYLQVALCAFLGFIRWGLLPNIKALNRTYGYMIELTKFCSIPFLILNLISILQPHVTPTQLFVSLHVIFFVTQFIIQLDADYSKNLSQIITILPLGVLAFDAFLQANFFKATLVGSFLAVPVVMKKFGVPLFHVVMCGIMWLFESARLGHYAQFKIPF